MAASKFNNENIVMSGSSTEIMKTETVTRALSCNSEWDSTIARVLS